MMKVWATVVAWKDGIVTLHAEAKISCNSCSFHKGCSSTFLKTLWSKECVIEIFSENPLQSGQCVELAIRKKKFLGLAILVYMTPLIGLFLLASLFQILFHSEIVTACGALFGSISGLTFVIKGISSNFGNRKIFQLITPNITISSDKS